MINCSPDNGTQVFVCAKTEVRNMEKRAVPIIVMASKIKSHRGREQARLTKMPEIAACALTCNATGPQCGPVTDVRQVVCGDAPRYRVLPDFRGVAQAKIEQIVLRHVGAVDVIHRSSPDMLPIEVQVNAFQSRQT